MSDKNQQTKTINIELREQEAEGIYANLALISHSASEFFVDFARLTPGVNKARVQARIVMTPQNLKNLHRALGENIARYESQHGQITTTGPNEQSISFQGIDGETKKKLN